MTAERAPTGSLEELREVAVENLDLVRFHADLGAGSGSVRADAGMVYHTRRAAAHLRMAIDVLKLLQQRQHVEAVQADERRADHGLSGSQRRGEGG